jgi:hypothetical protein
MLHKSYINDQAYVRVETRSKIKKYQKAKMREGVYRPIIVLIVFPTMSVTIYH